MTLKIISLAILDNIHLDESQISLNVLRRTAPVINRDRV